MLPAAWAMLDANETLHTQPSCTLFIFRDARAASICRCCSWQASSALWYFVIRGLLYLQRQVPEHELEFASAAVYTCCSRRALVVSLHSIPSAERDPAR